jgi:hypothetical protein
MNTTTRALFQTVLSSDASLSAPERLALQRVLDGTTEQVGARASAADGPLLITQKVAAKLLSVSRVTVWRRTKERVLHPVEILPGTWRYTYAEIVALAKAGMTGLVSVAETDAERVAVA